MLDIGSNSIRFVVYDIYGSRFFFARNGNNCETCRCSNLFNKIRCVLSFPHGSGRRNQQIFQPPRIRNVFEPLETREGQQFPFNGEPPCLFEEIRTATSLTVVPVSGKEEARLSAVGLLAGDPDARGLAADLGGASLELIRIDERMPGKRVSLPLGPFDAVGGNLLDADYQALIPLIDQQLEILPEPLSQTDTLYLIGGAWRNLAAIHMMRALYPLKTLQAYELDALDALLLARWAYNEGREQLLDWPGLRQRRAETLPYSGLLLERLIRRLQPKRVEVSLTGLREGLVFDHLPDAIKGRDALLDGCRDFASGSLQSELFGPPLIDFVEAISEALPITFGPKKDFRLRQAACLMAGLGKNLHPDYRAELVFEDVLYAPIAGLSHAQRVWLALTLFRSVTRKGKAPNQQAVDRLLNADQIMCAEALGETIRLAIVATGRTPDLVSSLTLSRDGDVLKLESERPDLLTRQVEFRLQKLADKLGLTHSI